MILKTRNMLAKPMNISTPNQNMMMKIMSMSTLRERVETFKLVQNEVETGRKVEEFKVNAKMQEIKEREIASKQRPETRVAVKIVGIETTMVELVQVNEALLQKVKDKIDPTSFSSVEAIENELRGEIAAVLGRAEYKLKAAIALAEEAARECDLSVAGSDDELRKIEKFKKLREKAFDARQAMIIQRQAAGFHLECVTLVQKNYPLPKMRQVKKKVN